MGEGWRVGVVQTPPAWSGGEVLGASEGVRRVLLGSSSSPKLSLRAHANEIARGPLKRPLKTRRRPQTLNQASRRRGVRRGAMGGRAGLRLGRGRRRTSSRGKKSTLLVETAPDTCRRVGGESGGLQSHSVRS